MIPQIPLVYIASNGHSGSTLLDLLLGAHPRVWTLGEAQLLPWELRNQRLCGCGQPISKDEFWKKILCDIPLNIEGYHIGYFRNMARVGKVLRWRILPDVVRNEISDKWRPAVQEYGEKNFQYFDRVREAAAEKRENKIKWLVDNSKDPYRLFWLQHSGMFQIRVVHLVKDPRAFVYSMMKITDSRDISTVFRYTGRWIVENAIISCVSNKSMLDENVKRITYDELALHPKQTLSNVGDWLGLEYDPHLVENFRDHENHAIAGNMMRWRNSEREIYHDERWKEALPRSVRRIIGILTKPFADYCGYPRLHVNL